MSFHRSQFETVIREALAQIEALIPVSETAVNLLLGTAAQESAFGTYLRQIRGPALGVFQMEPQTYNDIVYNYLAYRDDLEELVFANDIGDLDATRVVWDIRHAAIMARIHYYRVPHPLPEPDDIQGLAGYYKNFYNTSEGKATTEEFIENWRRYVA